MATKRELGKYFHYLDELRDSGVTNMFGAGPYIQDEFNLDRREAKRVVLAWIRAQTALAQSQDWTTSTQSK